MRPSRPLALLGFAGIGLVALVAWQVLGVPNMDTPARQVARYLAATSAGDEQQALDAWATFVGGIHPQAALLARRTALTHELVTLHVGRSYEVRSIDWWRTCCEPGRIEGPRNAGLARMHVRAIDAAGQDHQLVFEVFVKKLAWWGDAGGETIRDWTLYEVHRESEPCIFPSSAFGCS